MKATFSVNICNNQFSLQTININDIEYLRQWKNEHKEFFFYKNEISKIEQENWFFELNKRLSDHIFIVYDNTSPVGCIGARLTESCVDIYNVILGNKIYKGKHVMKNALWAVVSLNSLLYFAKPNRVSVLKNNPAINWYEKIGFKIINNFQDYVLMEFQDSIIDTKYNFNINISLPLI
jgi:hypothetical protein